MRAFLACLALAAPVAAASDLPSGLAVSPHDVLEERQPGGQVWLVLRYLAPEISGGAVGYEDVVEDLGHLCVTDGLVRAAAAEEPVTQIVVILMDRAVPRGTADPDATQYIGAYLPMGQECVWE